MRLSDDEEYSHSVLKRPRSGDFRVQEEHGGQIRSVTVDRDMLAAGQKIIGALGEPLLYARVDLVRLPSGIPWLMELELIEPSLYFSFDPEAPRRFAQTLDQLNQTPARHHRFPFRVKMDQAQECRDSEDGSQGQSINTE